MEDINPIGYTRVTQGFLYPSEGPGVAWNGLTDVVVHSGSPTTATVTAYTYPLSIEKYLENLSIASPRIFGLSYRTIVSEESILHILYNLYSTSTISSDVYKDFYWRLNTKPKILGPLGLTSYFTIRENELTTSAKEELESILYGTNDSTPTLPSYERLLDILTRGTLCYPSSLQATFEI